MNEPKPLIVNSDFSVLLEVKSPAFPTARDAISPFLELVKSPEVFYTYHLNEISLWNGYSTGLTAEDVLGRLGAWSRFPVPAAVARFVKQQWDHFGLVKLVPYDDEALEVVSEDGDLLRTLVKTREIAGLMAWSESLGKFTIPRALQGVFKLEMIKMGFPVEDRVGFEDGDPLPFKLHEDHGMVPRKYQVESLGAFYGGLAGAGGAGIIVLPCGAGKTLVGILAMARLQMKTLIISPNIVALRQWKSELLRLSTLTEADIGEYSGELKELRAVTLTTYQILVYRHQKNDAFKHLNLFGDTNWGLIVYDEIHLLPAPVFRAVASIQAKRRLGLTATLVREDGHERDVFALIGPKKFDLPWKELEAQDFIAKAICLEVRVGMDEELTREYFRKTDKNQFRLASENPAKTEVIRALIERLADHRVLIIGQYLDQLESLAERFRLPLITGRMPNPQRVDLYNRFRAGEIPVLLVSKVANFAIDLPDADVAIQISGTYGSRQEEAQRLGRILRPKPGHNRAWFFTLVTADTKEELYAQNRKRFLLEQGYQYQVLKSGDVISGQADVEGLESLRLAAAP
ncbi:MAG: DEAD/DEAH box helicase [Spirochaetes bacterium]|nr:DEAD/DEAH box helicase [Spirochaetota bacterium]